MVTVDSVVFICFSFSFVCILSLTYLTWVKLVLMRGTQNEPRMISLLGDFFRNVSFPLPMKVMVMMVVELVKVDVLTNNNL